jgi:hypothetical protein
LPAPTAAAKVTPVSGTGTCSTADLGKSTTDAKVVTHDRGGTYTCRVTTTDPRVTGTETASWNMDRWGTADNGALVQWGSGFYPSDRGDIIVSWYRGTGGYAGLACFKLLGPPFLFGPNPGVNVKGVFGQVLPGDPPTP